MEDHKDCTCPYCPTKVRTTEPLYPVLPQPAPRFPSPWKRETTVPSPYYKPPCRFCSGPILMVIPPEGIPCPGGCGAWLYGSSVTCSVSYSSQ